LRKMFGIPDSNNLDSAEVKFEVGYWRKANHIHTWFVKNVQDGEDKCDSYPVSKKQLLELKKQCLIVIKDKKKSDEILPTSEGFFFGGTEYDEFYFEELQRTAEMIDRCLNFDKDDEWGFEYRSSW